VRDHETGSVARDPETGDLVCEFVTVTVKYCESKGLVGVDTATLNCTQPLVPPSTAASTQMGWTERA
jgi:hypothetical protein